MRAGVCLERLRGVPQGIQVSWGYLMNDNEDMH